MIYLQNQISIQMDMLAAVRSLKKLLSPPVFREIWQGVPYMKKERLSNNQKYIALFLATSSSLHLNYKTDFNLKPLWGLSILAFHITLM